MRMYSLHCRYNKMFCNICSTPLEGWNYADVMEVNCPKGCEFTLTEAETHQFKMALLNGEVECEIISKARTWIGMVWLNFFGEKE